MGNRMPSRLCRSGLTALVLVCLGGGARAADFDRAFAAVVIRHCVSCHNATEHKGGLDLTREEGLAEGGDSGPAVVPGKPDESYLIRRVAEGSMPPRKKG